jgi:NAD(P)-dependent dehydrogenase (short-subunit alcohol dehydrogenase family)
MRLAGEGASVILVGRGAAALEQVALEIKEASGSARVLTADLADSVDIARLVEEAGQVDILVNNAAAEEQWAGIVGAAISQWRNIFEVNVFAPVQLMSAFGMGMTSRSHGVIVNMSSIGGARAASPMLGTYAASKAALDMVTRVAAMELAGSGVRVNSIASGITDMGKTYELLPPALLADIGRIIPARRLGTERDIAGVVSFLCSDEASYINGHVLTVDGAMTAGAWSTSTVTIDSMTKESQ